MTRCYRTLIHGKLRQQSALTVGGSPEQPGGADIQCARDGLGRLTIPGSSLAGCLIETAGRVFPQLFAPADRAELWGRITSKTHAGVAEEVLQSLLQFRPAHRERDEVGLRQGVGIRQKTMAAAVEGQALFDLETLPPGEDWDFFLEIDALRGGEKVEAVALYALSEWAEGRCWLGASAARGLGWMKLEDVEILRLPLTREAVDAWPDCTQRWPDPLPALRSLAGVERVQTEGLRDLARRLWGAAPLADAFCYVVLTAAVSAGPRADGYGLDVLSVGGHAAGLLTPLLKNMARPLGMDPTAFAEDYAPDAPVVTEGAGGAERPVVPGSGIRGPLRAAASRWWRPRLGDEEKIPDPNVNDPGTRDRPKKSDDPVSRLFGLVEHSGQLLASDARLAGDVFRLACLQHHAEDEFAGGVFGSGKFNRTAVLEGTFRVRLVIEAPTAAEACKHLDTLLPALRLAELGFVPLGGAKMRGCGWLPWKFEKVEYGRAGGPLAELPLRTAGADAVATLVRHARDQLGGGEG
jgi:CRISPR/Cas system CSM-associated protein Csm3 (group 7 of RAMP superfamily)